MNLCTCLSCVAGRGCKEPDPCPSMCKIGKCERIQMNFHAPALESIFSSHVLPCGSPCTLFSMGPLQRYMNYIRIRWPVSWYPNKEIQHYIRIGERLKWIRGTNFWVGGCLQQMITNLFSFPSLHFALHFVWICNRERGTHGTIPWNSLFYESFPRLSYPSWLCKLVAADVNGAGDFMQGQVQQGTVRAAVMCIRPWHLLHQFAQIHFAVWTKLYL